MKELEWETTNGTSKTTLPNTSIEVSIELGDVHYTISCPVLGLVYQIPTSDIIALQRLKVLALMKVASALETKYNEVQRYVKQHYTTETHLPWLK